MLLSYLVLAVLGAILTARLALWHSRYVVVAAAGTLLAVLAVPTGFSIGIYLAPLSLALLVVAAAPHLGPR